MTDRTLVLMTRVDGEEVLVLMDRAGAPAPRRDEGSTLNVYKVQFGEVDAYEVTPLPFPKVLLTLKEPGA